MDTQYLETLREGAKLKGQRKLALETALSRQSLYNLFRNRDTRMSTLTKVCKSLGYELQVQLRPSRDAERAVVHSALHAFGAPLYDNQTVTFSLEHALLLALNAAKRDKMVADALPYVLALNADKLDLIKLLYGLDPAEGRQLLGYFADLANRFRPSEKLKLLGQLLHRIDFSQLNLSSDQLPGKFASKLLGRVVNSAAKKWNVLTFSSEKDLLDRYKKWQNLSTQSNS